MYINITYLDLYRIPPRWFARLLVPTFRFRFVKYLEMYRYAFVGPLDWIISTTRFDIKLRRLVG